MSKKAKTPKETKYDFRDVVLAKVRGYPPWPGMVVDPENVTSEVAKERPANKKSHFYCVRFFPKGEHAWLVSKDISRLQQHEIEAYINEPYKKSGDLLTGYRIALDPTKWEEELENKRVEAAEAEENAEVDQLEAESSVADADADADEDDKPIKPKKRKRDSEPAPSKVKGKPKSKKASAEPAGKKKPAAGAKGKKNGAKSKAMVESEDEADPEAVKVREWRHRLQKTFLTDGKDPKPEDMPACDELFTAIEQYEKMNIHYLLFSKIGKVMRHIYMQTPEKIPRDDDFHFRDRANVLVEKWHALMNANKDSVENGTAKVNGAVIKDAPSSEEPKASEPNVTAESEVKRETAEDVPMEDVEAKENTDDVVPKTETNGVAESAETADGDLSVLADVTMSEA
ncbi:hypothetical protein HETIRDRAFT_319450 [Heterobasidion irregulare TC 32-1]|uniref:PWWP domain-containing protein n=1 Tax=Heterobasidion irregulare (strain TC 32-1) TaxID=747525 RepID=W4K5W8_HETIT|nr:uncharacterized protein HETIRDRAFT_319450 [Heterobasidion irregulare TC 32-1]ETW81208.1 hypothetical protein HETIRDRAFT_319450 [Heterobasidion irregulare TC 32-1]